MALHYKSHVADISSVCVGREYAAYGFDFKMGESYLPQIFKIIIYKELFQPACFPFVLVSKKTNRVNKDIKQWGVCRLGQAGVY